MINAALAYNITGTCLRSKAYFLKSLEHEIISAANAGHTSVNVTCGSITPLYRQHLTDLGYEVLDCRFDDEWYVQVSWGNK